MKLKLIFFLCAILLLGALLWIPKGPALPPGLTFAQSNQNNFPGSSSGGSAFPVTVTGGVSGAVPCFTATTTESAGTLLAANALVLGGGAGVCPSTSANFGVSGGQLNIGAVGTQGILGLVGTTSGTATITGPATAGTSTNADVFSNVLALPDGSVSNAAVSRSADVTTGIFFTAGHVSIATGGAKTGDFLTNTLNLSSNQGTLSFGAGADGSVSRDQTTAGVVDIGTGGSGSTAGGLKAAYIQSAGTKFTTNAGCGESAGTTTGGATAGKFTTAGSTSCTSIITFGNTATATNGWDCHAVDLTTAADANNPHISSSTATTATIVSGTIVASDVIQFSCIAY